MADRHDIFDHTVVIDSTRHGWRAQVWRSTFDGRGVIVGSVVVGEVTSWSRRIVRYRARRLAEHARSRQARWPHHHAR